MRYLGGKGRLVGRIHEVVESRYPGLRDITDGFGGTNAVASHFKTCGFRVTTNDALYFSYALAKGSVGLNRRPQFNKLRIAHNNRSIESILERVASGKARPNYLRESYSPAGVSKRRYFTESNALRIQRLRDEFDLWRQNALISEAEFFYLLGGLIRGVPSISNITGTYGAFLKQWDKRALNIFDLDFPIIRSNGQRNRCFNEDLSVLVQKTTGGILYLDPPYNNRQYLSNYHLLETIARNDQPAVSGITGVRPGGFKSLWCNAETAVLELENVTRSAQFDVIVLSYNTEGLLSRDLITETLSSFGSVHVEAWEYPRFKSQTRDAKPSVHELLFTLEKK
jgi:adenine-specific DNA-methyltransferase